MKRSEINKLIKDTITYLEKIKFYLPEWAYWNHRTWVKNKAHCKKIFDLKLGWDIFNPQTKFLKVGAVLFTIRNGKPGDFNYTYCEKIIVMEAAQTLPYHYHKVKTEDIINRSDIQLGFKLIKCDKHGKALNDEIEVSIDGIMRKLKKEEELVLHKGQSLTLYPYVAHQFYPKDKKGLIGEVSRVNDDVHDNFFIDSEIYRFPIIEEDEAILYPTVLDYKKLH